MGPIRAEHIPNVLVRALNQEIRMRLTKHFEQQSAPVIKEMVEECIKGFDLKADFFRDNMNLRDTIEFIFRDVTERKAAE